ncbi:MAG: hypothetical protein ACOX75_04690 [Lachnospiraceae bacterium]
MLELSEKEDTIVVLRMTTRVCHFKTIVELNERVSVEPKEYVKNAVKYIPVPANSLTLVKHSYNKLDNLKEYSENCPFNTEKIHSIKTGIVCSGCSYYFAKEVFGEDASYYKVGFVNPFPIEIIKAFAAKIDMVYVIEETDPLKNEMKLAEIDRTKIVGRSP